MSIKPQDVVVLCKLLAKHGDQQWSQNSIASELFLSPSQVNSAFKRLVEAGLLTQYHSKSQPEPVLQACEEFFIYALKYIFPANLGEMSRGIPTSYGAHFKKEMVMGSDPIPVWPYAEGKKRGVALKPLYHTVPKSVDQNPDPLFYELLGLLDAIRSGRAREKKIAAEKISHLLRK